VSTLKVHVDRSLCSGHAQCAVYAPELYVLDDEGYIALPPVTEVPSGLREAALAGAANCPERVITCVEED
jgi:ferredoxin